MVINGKGFFGDVKRFGKPPCVNIQTRRRFPSSVTAVQLEFARLPEYKKVACTNGSHICLGTETRHFSREGAGMADSKLFVGTVTCFLERSHGRQFGRQHL